VQQSPSAPHPNIANPQAQTPFVHWPLQQSVLCTQGSPDTAQQ
jgi:hypothetical protein